MKKKIKSTQNIKTHTRNAKIQLGRGEEYQGRRETPSIKSTKKQNRTYKYTNTREYTPYITINTHNTHTHDHD